MAISENAAHIIPRAEAFAGGEVFQRLFNDGMALVDETACYLDGPGRDVAQTLTREAGLTYAAWSMELSTRLMQAASWLVMQKAVRDGDMAPGDALASKYRVHRDAPPLDASAQRERGLPGRFLDLVERCENLFERICRLDDALYSEALPEIESPIGSQLRELERAAANGVFDPLKLRRPAS